MEGLGRIIQKPYSLGHFHGLWLYGKEYPILHQKYVDDVVLYGLRTM